MVLHSHYRTYCGPPVIHPRMSCAIRKSHSLKDTIIMSSLFIFDCCLFGTNTKEPQICSTYLQQYVEFEIGFWIRAILSCLLSSIIITG